VRDDFLNGVRSLPGRTPFQHVNKHVMARAGRVYYKVTRTPTVDSAAGSFTHDVRMPSCPVSVDYSEPSGGAIAAPPTQENMKAIHRHPLTFTLLPALMLAATVHLAQAQIGSGWTQKSYTKSISIDGSDGLHTVNYTTDYSVDNPPSARYHYLSSNDSEYFDIFDNRSNRSEIRLHNEYSTGSRQFQGYVRFSSPLDDESLFQIFGSTSGATLCMMRGYASSGGSIRTVGGGGTIATGVYGVEQRINAIHYQGSRVEFYVNGSHKVDITDNESVTNYWKYGCYGTLRTGSVQVRWRQVRTYTK
jgi:hypothetical protein